MVGRSFPLYSLSETALTVVAVTGTFTAIFAATMALAQFDIKRVLAYSTVSQLGYMFMALGVGAFTAGIFHLMTHAFFKALLFLCAGSVMHAMNGETDFRKMGGLKQPLNKTYVRFLVGGLAISGIIPFAGFFQQGCNFTGCLCSTSLHHLCDRFSDGCLNCLLYIPRDLPCIFCSTKRSIMQLNMLMNPLQSCCVH